MDYRRIQQNSCWEVAMLVEKGRIGQSEMKGNTYDKKNPSQKF
jgi:PIN domain nuclease of toxin-antitoxin system